MLKLALKKNLIFIIQGCLFFLATSCMFAYEINAAIKISPLTLNQNCSNYDITYHRCYWDVTEFNDGIKGVIVTHFKPLTETMDCISFDMHQELIPDSVIYQGIQIPFVHLNNKITISFPKPLQPGSLDSITVSYHGTPNNKAVEFFAVPYLEGIEPDGSYFARTFSQPYFAKEWWPCKESLLDKIDSIEINIKTRPGLQAISNGTLQNFSNEDSISTYRWSHKFPIAYYLVAFAVGDYTVHQQQLKDPKRGTEFSFKNYLFKAPDSTAKIDMVNGLVARMQKFIDTLGFYPFFNDGYSQTIVKYFSGGMENQTNSFIRNNWNEGIILHEFAHQWFGDYITCGSWRDLWLNESFATYFQERDFPWPENTVYNQYRIGLTENIAKNPSQEKYIYKTDTLNLDLLFNYATYYQGSYVLDMLEYTLGWPAFLKGIQTYLIDTTIAYGNANTEKLLASMEQASSKNLQNFFQSWIYGNAMPIYNIKWFQNNDSLRILISQTLSDNQQKHFIEMPIEFVAKGEKTKQLIRVEHTKNNQYFSIAMNSKIDTLEFNPNHRIMCKDYSITKDPTLLSSDFQKSVSTAFSFAIFKDLIVVEDNTKTAYTKFVELTDMNGKRIIYAEFQELVNLSLPKLASGVYAIHAYSKYNRFSKKFLVTNQD